MLRLSVEHVAALLESWFRTCVQRLPECCCTFRLTSSCSLQPVNLQIRRAGEGMYRVARQAQQQPLQRSPSGSSLGGLPPSYPVSAAASRSDTEDGSVFMPVSILRRQGLLH